MILDEQINAFLSKYDEVVFENAVALRQLILSLLPNIIEQIDLPAKMIAYAYGQKYAELICVLIPSKKGLKLGFNRGAFLSDPEKLLEGQGIISRYVVIHSKHQIHSDAIQNLIQEALELYHQFQENKIKT